MNDRTVLVDLRCCQFDADRGIPAYAQSLALELVRGGRAWRWLLLRDPRWPAPTRFAELATHGTWCTAADLDGPRPPAIDAVLTGCFFLPHHGCNADYLLPPWLRRRQPLRLGIVYDLVPLLFPDRYLARERGRRQYHHALGALRSSDHLFAISHATRRDTIRHAAVDPLRVECIYGDVDHAKRAEMARPAEESAGLPARYGLQRPYCVCIGGGDWRKNMEVTVAAFARFHRDHPDHRLAIVCTLQPARIAELRGQAAAAGLPPEAVACTGHVSDRDLVGLVRHAEMLVYPSLYEGLGLPVLEAYGCGTPAVGSATSSVAELVIPELACDPRDPAAVAAAMARLAASPALREKSLSFGRRLVAEECGWGRAAGKVLGRLEALFGGAAPRGIRSVSPRPRLAVVAALPPARTGIAGYTLRYLQAPDWETTFFAVGAGPRIDVPAGVLPGNRVLPAEVFPAAALRGRHDTALFVLGNSPHHAGVLDAMLASRGMAHRRLAYLHEAALESLFRAWLGPEADRLPAAPTPARGPDWIERALLAKPGFGRPLRLLAERAGLDGLVVNSEACRDLVRAALGPLAERWTIDVAFHPVPDMPAAARAAAAGGPLRIGSFGLAGDTKRLDLLAGAAAILGRRRSVRLVIAGWEVGRFCRRIGLAAADLEVLDSPPDAALLAAMRGVDVAVQLRSPTFGESSGVVSQLLAVGTPLVVTAAGSFAELPADVAAFVPPDCPPADLAAAIEAAAARPIAPGRRDEIRAALSPRSFAARFAEILAAGPRAQAARRDELGRPRTMTRVASS